MVIAPDDASHVQPRPGAADAIQVRTFCPVNFSPKEIFRAVNLGQERLLQLRSEPFAQ